jgi:hypothetical protein
MYVLDVGNSPTWNQQMEDEDTGRQAPCGMLLSVWTLCSLSSWGGFSIASVDSETLRATAPWINFLGGLRTWLLTHESCLSLCTPSRTLSITWGGLSGCLPHKIRRQKQSFFSIGSAWHRAGHTYSQLKMFLWTKEYHQWRIHLLTFS